MNLESSFKQLKTTQANDAFVSMLRKELSSRFDAKPQPFPFMRYALASLIALFLLSLMGTGVVLAAYKSQPGQLLYPVKVYLQTKINPPAKKETINNSTPIQTMPTTTPATVLTPPSPTPTVSVTPTKPVIIQVNIQLPKQTVSPTPLPTVIPVLPSPTPIVQANTNISVAVPINQTTPNPTPTPLVTIQTGITLPVIGNTGINVGL